MGKLLSIVIPSYNSENTITKALESILIEKHLVSQNVEIIICDDCSDDKSTLILEKFFKAGLIKLIRNNSNLGPGISRNKCIEVSQGRWIAFLDSDDSYKINGLKILIDSISFYDKNDVDLVIFNDSYKNDKNLNLKNNYLKLQTDGSVIYSCVRKNIIKENKIIFSKGYHEDVDFQFKLISYAKNIKIVENNIYEKSNTKNSIVNTISRKHVDGFFRAWKEIFNLIKKNNKLLDKIKIGTVGLVSTRIRLILQNEPKIKMQINLLEYLKTKLNEFLVYTNLPVVIDKPFTRYEKIYNLFNNTNNFNKNVLDKLNDLENKSWSCSDLENSIFFGPDEIRTCCKRFFHNGEMKGDVVLLRAKKNNFDSQDIKKSKHTLIKNINKGNETPCSGCPYLEFKDWKQSRNNNFSYISMEYHSICNLKCSYCSEKYYGGLDVRYNIYKLIEDLIKSNSFNENATFVWGGGEPTIVKNFNELIGFIINNYPNSKQKVLSNSVVFSKKIQDLVDNGKIDLVTSIDSGNESTFLDIRGKNKFFDVFKNLSKYSQSKPENVVIKFIFTEGNLDLKEVIEFANVIKNRGLIKNVFQISTDFNDETINLKQLRLIIAMYGFLIEKGVKIIFLDDLVTNRIRKIDAKEKDLILQYLDDNNIHNPIANPKHYESVNIWGAGWNTKFLLEKTDFFKKVKVENIIDDTPQKINKVLSGHKIKSSHNVDFNSAKLIVSAVQGYPKIYLKALKMGVEEHTIINKIVL